MQKNNPQGSLSAGGTMMFSMPMFHRCVPKWIRPWLYVLLAFCFQFSNGMYLGAMNNVIGERGIIREDLQMCLYATLIGMAVYFPLLFRMKFRFSNKALLMVAAAVIAVCQIVTTFSLPLPLLWLFCVICGMAKIQGTFECMSTIQLWMTPKRDFGVFFPLLHIILLTSIEVTGYLAAWFAYNMHWTYMHWFVLGMMLCVLLVQSLFTKPFHAIPQKVPLIGVDWIGAILWIVFFLQTAWLLNYGDWLDWWNSSTFRLVCGTSLVTLALSLQRMLYRPQAFYEPAMLCYRYFIPIALLIGVVEALFSTEHVLEMVYYEEVMHYEDHTYEMLNQLSLLGIWVGCLFSLGWLRLMRWNVYKLIAFALGFYCLYVGGFYVLIDEHLSIGQIALPLIFRGFSYSILSIALMWCLHEIMSFQHFFQALSIFNILHMYVGGLIGAALHSRGLKYYVGDAFARCSQYVDSVRMSSSPIEFAAFMDRFVGSALAQSVKILFGWTLIVGIFMCLFMLMWDIPMVRRQIKHIPSWPKVGIGVWTQYRRWQRHRKKVRM